MTHSIIRALWRSVLPWVVALLVVTPSGAEDRYQGVASCASSLCHAATAPLGEHPIQQDEYFIWQRQDAHSRAYQTLHSAQSRQMAQRLGLDAANAPACLACHAETTASGPQHQRSDGIGCESCHGGSERWLPQHTRPGVTLDEKVALGMKPLWQRDTRAALCLGCHQGDAEHPISHAMMAAGHPRLVFELDTFTALQPPHHRRDADYAARKGAYQPAQDWLAGQMQAARQHLQALASGRISQGFMPEWIEFDCSACHHRMDAARAQPARMPGSAPGAIPFADAPQALLGLWLGAVAPEEAKAWREAQRSLHAAQASGLGAVQAAASQQLQLLDTRLPALRAQPMSVTQLRSLLRALASDTSHQNAALTSEQRAMALTVMADALRLQGAPLSVSAQRSIAAYYRAVHSVDGFDIKAHQRALDAVASAMPR